MAREEPDLYSVDLALPDAGPSAAMRLVTTASGTELRLHVRQRRPESFAGPVLFGAIATGMIALFASGSALVASIAAFVALVGLVLVSPKRPAYSVNVPRSERGAVTELLRRVQAAVGESNPREPYR